MRTKVFWADLAERVIATFAMSLAAVLSAGGFLGLFNVSWLDALSVAGMAALLSALKGIAAAGVGREDSASLVPAVGSADDEGYGYAPINKPPVHPAEDEDFSGLGPGEGP